MYRDAKQLKEEAVSFLFQKSGSLRNISDALNLAAKAGEFGIIHDGALSDNEIKALHNSGYNTHRHYKKVSTGLDIEYIDKYTISFS